MCYANDILDVVWAEELAHELSAPVAFFDRWTRRLARGETVEAEDLEIAGEEVVRLRRLIASMRSIRVPEMHVAPRVLNLLVAEAVQNHRARSADGGELEIEQDVPAGITTEVSATFSRDVIGPLLEAVAASTCKGGQIEMRGEVVQKEVVVTLRGAPVSVPLVLDAQPWRTDNAVGRRLAIACRIARAHGGRVTRDLSLGGASLRLTLLVRHDRAATGEP